MRLLTIVASGQLELLPAVCDPAPAVVWASLPERNRDTVLALLGRLIAAGAVDDSREEVS